MKTFEETEDSTINGSDRTLGFKAGQYSITLL